MQSWIRCISVLLRKFIGKNSLKNTNITGIIFNVVTNCLIEHLAKTNKLLHARKKYSACKLQQSCCFQQITRFSNNVNENVINCLQLLRLIFLNELTKNNSERKNIATWSEFSVNEIKLISWICSKKFYVQNSLLSTSRKR